MPLYEYVCSSCGNRYEKIQKVDEQPDIACPKCGGEVERPLSAPAFQFKGSGWYITDYAKKPGGGGGKAATSGASSESSNTDSDSSSSSGAESKPADAESKPASTPSSSSSSSSTPSS